MQSLALHALLCKAEQGSNKAICLAVNVASVWYSWMDMQAAEQCCCHT